jgi:hypothetical protein
VNALADPATGSYINENFVAAYQKVGTFRIVGGQKQGGNVATYFCAPDGRVLNVVAGPVDSATLLKEARWTVAAVKRAQREGKGDGAAFKNLFRQWHSERLRQEHGLVAEPVTFDAAESDAGDSALTYRDPSGRPLAPALPPPPLDGPDVRFNAALQKPANTSDAMPVRDRAGRAWPLGNQGKVHLLLAAHAMVKIEKLYGSVFENILGERVTTKPVEIADPFPWLAQARR